MRKYLRSKDQADNNSQIFKEAKRRFHYEPNHKQQKYFLHSKHKQPNNNSHQFKDDFSSVKEIKNETNEINESSWIVKLVNVMHENSEEDAKTNPSAGAPSNFLGLHPIESKEINIVERPFVVQKKAQAPSGNEASNNMTPVATKKNSVNIEMNKKKSKSQKSQSCDTVSRKGKSSVKVQTVKRFKNEVISNKKHSQSLPKSEQKKQVYLDQKSKCTKNVSCSKITSQKVKNDQNSTGSQHVHSSKHFSCNFGIDSKLNSQVNKPTADTSKDKLKLSQDALKMECSINYQEVKEKVNNILAQEDTQNLFATSTNQKNTEAQTAEKRAYVGSIKKNKPSEGSQQKQPPAKNQIPKTQQQNKLEVIDKKVKLSEDEDIVTAREEQVLIDKYLNNDYSFKKQSNLFRYEYATSEFDRSLSHLNKPSIALERPLNTAKIIAKTDDKYQSNVLLQGEKQLSKRQGYRKFNYFADKGEKETTQNSLSLEILTLRCNQQTPKHQEIDNGIYSKFNKHQNRDVEIYSSTKQLIPCKSHKEEELRKIHLKYNHQRNKQNDQLHMRRPTYEPVLEGRRLITKQKEAKRNESNAIPTKRENLIQIRPANIINRNPYLEESTMKTEEIKSQTQEQRLVTSTFEYPTFKCEPKAQQSEFKPQFRRQSGEISSGLDNLNSISRRQCNQSDIISEAESDQLITRLNSKLNNYITHYRLEKPSEQISPREFEPTHRKMNLNFNQLKKHHDLFQR